MPRIGNLRLQVFALAAAGLLTGFVAPPEAAATEMKPTTDPRFDAAKEQIESLVDSGALVSAAIGVIENGEVAWAEAFGDADRENDEAASLHTPYGIASMGKAITATAVMTLVDAGKLDLDASVTDILGDDALRIYVGAQAPTVRELLNMTSGVPHGALTYIEAAPVDENVVLDAQSIVVFPPGEVLHYSNFSMALAERVIEKVSGQTYDDYVKNAVFSPLGMKDARIGANAPGAAARYGDNGERLGPLTPYPRSSRQISASLSDILKFAALHLGAPLGGQPAGLPPELTERMHYERAELGGGYVGLGIANFDLAEGRHWVMSSGNDLGVQSSMILLPEDGVGAVFLTNTSGYQADEIAIIAADAASPGFLNDAMAVIGAFEGRTQAFQPDANWLGEWTGAVASAEGEIPVRLTISEDGGVAISYDGAKPAAASEVAIRDGMLSGVFEGVLPLIESPDGPHRIEFGLVLNDGELAGFATANFRGKRGKFEIPTPMHLQQR